MNKYENQVFDQERALYGSDGIEVSGCRFDGPADGETSWSGTVFSISATPSGMTNILPSAPAK